MRLLSLILLSLAEVGDIPQALEWMQVLVSIAPTDPDALAHTAELFDKENDKSQAYQHMLEVGIGAQYHFDGFLDSLLLQSFRYFPANLSTLAWMGAYFVDSQFCEKAIQYFERAAAVQFVPNAHV